MSLDFSQIELRVGAFYCRDEKMLETYRNGGDIHAQTTSVIFNVPFEAAVDKNAPDYKEHRTIAKNCNFGVFYGLFPKGLQQTLKFKAGLDTSLDRCKEIIRNLKAGYPGLTKWQEATKKRAQVTCYALCFEYSYSGNSSGYSESCLRTCCWRTSRKNVAAAFIANTRWACIWAACG